MATEINIQELTGEDIAATDLPEKFNGNFGNLTQELISHIDNKENPHNVTAAQLGLSNAYIYKGSVATYQDLIAIQNPENGWVYDVKQEDKELEIAAGSNFAWNGTEWDNLGGKMSGLVKKVNDISPDNNGNIEVNTIKKKLYITPETTDKEGGQITLQKADNATISINIDNYGDEFRIFGDEQVGNEFKYSPLTGDLKINGTLYNVKSIYTSSSNPTLIIGQPNASSQIEIRDKSSSAANPGTILLTVKNRGDSSIYSMRPNGDFVVNKNNTGDKFFEFVESKGSNYIRYKNGLQICFGDVIFQSAGTTINYAQPFSLNPVIIPVAYGTGSTTTKIDNNTTTGFTAYNTGNWHCGWLAIGYWK